jgi:predicted negative regulator of RcsB-dependent stress response
VAARIVLGDLYTQQGKKTKAKEQYQAVIRLKPFGVNLAEVKKKLSEIRR